MHQLFEEAELLYVGLQSIVFLLHLLHQLKLLLLELLVLCHFRSLSCLPSELLPFTPIREE